MLQNFNTLTTDVSWAKIDTYESEALVLNIPFNQAVEFHENAKNFIKAIVARKAIFENKAGRPRDSVTFVNPHSIATMAHNEPTATLNPNIFSYRETTGVQKFIQQFRDSGCTDIHVFGAASQFNSTEAAEAFVPKCGFAHQFAQNDHTQGPAVQKENRKIFEVIGVAANFGLNSLSNVLNTELAYNALSNGYLMPNKEQLAAVVDCFIQNGDKMEVTCYHCDGVEVVLTAAPATGYNPAKKSFDSNMNDRLEQNAAALAYSAQFNRYIELLKANSDSEKRLVGHMTGVGLGVFANNPVAVANGFKQAALQFQQDLNQLDIDPNRVKVIYEVFTSDFYRENSSAMRFKTHLNLELNPHPNLDEFGD